MRGRVVWLVEQRTENPRVGGSIPSLAIPKTPIEPRDSRADGGFAFRCSSDFSVIGGARGEKSPLEPLDVGTGVKLALRDF